MTIIEKHVSMVNRSNADYIYNHLYKRLEKEHRDDCSQHVYPLPMMYDWSTMAICKPHFYAVMRECTKHF